MCGPSCMCLSEGTRVFLGMLVKKGRFGRCWSPRQGRAALNQSASPAVAEAHECEYVHITWQPSHARTPCAPHVQPPM